MKLTFGRDLALCDFKLSQLDPRIKALEDLTKHFGSM